MGVSYLVAGFYLVWGGDDYYMVLEVALRFWKQIVEALMGADLFLPGVVTLAGCTARRVYSAPRRGSLMSLTCGIFIGIAK